MRTLILKTQVMNIHIIGSGGGGIVSDWLYANEFVLGVRNCDGKNNFAAGLGALGALTLVVASLSMRSSEYTTYAPAIIAPATIAPMKATIAPR